MERTALFLCHGPKHWPDEFGSAGSVRDILKGEDGGKKKNIHPVSLEGNVFPAPFSLKLQQQIIAETMPKRQLTRVKIDFGANVALPGQLRGGGVGGRPWLGRETELPRKPPLKKVLSTCWASEASWEPPAAALQGARPFSGPKLSFAPLGRGDPWLSPGPDFRCESV